MTGFFRVTELVSLGGEGLLLAGLETRFFQHVQVIAQVLHAAGLLLVFLDQFGIGPVAGDKRLIRLRCGRHERLMLCAAEGVQKLHVIFGVHQKLMLMLSMHVH